MKYLFLIPLIVLLSCKGKSITEKQRDEKFDLMKEMSEMPPPIKKNDTLMEVIAFLGNKDNAPLFRSQTFFGINKKDFRVEIKTEELVIFFSSNASEVSIKYYTRTSKPKKKTIVDGDFDLKADYGLIGSDTLDPRSLYFCKPQLDGNDTWNKEAEKVWNNEYKMIIQLLYIMFLKPAIQPAFHL